MSTPSAAREEEMTLEKFNMWNKQSLQEYLRQRELPVTGTKDELVALGYAAWRMMCPIMPTPKEKLKIRATEYSQLLVTTDGSRLPDPLSDIEHGWEGEQMAMTKWPCTMIVDIGEYLAKHETDIEKASLRKRLLCDYKEGKAFSYFSSRFLFEILYHSINDESPYCFLKTKCRPSYAVNDDPHDLWVCIQKGTGIIHSGYCTCFAGYA